MEIFPIRTPKDAQGAMARIEALMDALPGTPEGDELDILAALVETWERTHEAIEPA